MEKIKTALERAEKNRLRHAAEGDTARSRQVENDMTPEQEPLEPLEPLTPADVPPVVHTLPPGRGSQVTDPDGFEYTGTTVVRVDPEHLERHRIRLPEADDEVSQAFDLTASRLVDRIRETGWNSIGVVSAAAGEGKTVTALNIAMRLATSAKRTALVVDLDFRRPKVANYLGLQPSVGLEDVLRGDAGVQEALVSPGVQRLTVLPIRAPIEHPGRLLDSSRMAQLAVELKKRYANRIILFDLPPLLGHGDALNFLANTDAALFVASAGRTSEASLEQAMESLQSQNVIGTVLTRTEDLISAY